ncbi:MAG TPA: lysylphosphatidylglycerol synthase transmembrane domain-containing protein [Dermatophilaceae bacterium]|nr:lysylphosphatidylglycerol synthase transmembrane domain-containing protein [Dermatophilaceae bacterium]
MTAPGSEPGEARDVAQPERARRAAGEVTGAPGSGGHDGPGPSAGSHTAESHTAESHTAEHHPAQRRAARTPWGRARRAVEVVVGLGLAVVLIVWGVPYFAKTTWGAIGDVLGTVPLQSVLFFQALMLSGLWCYTFTITGSLPGISHVRALIVNLCGSSVSNLLPGGGAAGLVVTYAICRSWGFSNRATSTSVIVTGVWNVLARIALPVIAIVVLWWGNTGLPTALTDAATAGGLTGLLVLAAFVAMLASERAAQAIGSGLDRALAPLLRRRGRERTMSVEAVVRDLRGRIGHVVSAGWLRMTLGMVGFFGLYYALFVSILRTTGVQQDLGVLFAAFAIGRLLTAVGVTPGGVGVTETATVAALVAWGSPPAPAAAGVILFSVFTHLMEVPLGGIGWLAWTFSTKAQPPPEGSEHPVA